MTYLRNLCRIFTALAVSGASSGSALADVVRLASGSEFHGKIVATDATGALTIELLSGAKVKLPGAEVTLQVVRPVAVEEYELRARQVADTVEARWDLADWCRQKGLTPQRESQLLRLVELDPDHERARAALGHVWKDGMWVDWDAYMTARGYVKHRGKYITQQELELLEKTSDELKREQDWFPKVRLWAGWVTANNPARAQQGMTALRALKDPDAAPAIARFLGEHNARELRMLGVTLLTQGGGMKSAVALSKIALRDHDQEIRFAALQGIEEPFHEKVQAIFIKELRTDNNALVNRAAAGLMRVGDERCVPQLIDALVTAHKYEVRVPGGSGQTYSFGTNGTFAQPVATLPPDVEAAIRTGQLPQGAVFLNSPNGADNVLTKTVTVRMEHQNADVRAALQRLTKEDFGYDERLWHLWWSAKKHSGAPLTNS
ncbi:MAG TPA: hypothetical protein VFG20_19430 [Planctomycetaceae bacterium]|nr:hypothetical protein [Planctomycetaceae bacterium]